MPKLPVPKPQLAWALAGAHMALIFYFSHQPSVPAPQLFPHFDKLLHFSAYGPLGLFFAWALRLHRRGFWLAWGLAALYGFSDEFHQGFVPGREVSALDWLADLAGGGLGAWLGSRGHRIPSTAKGAAGTPAIGG